MPYNGNSLEPLHGTSSMVIIKDKHRFEFSVKESYGEWLASLHEYVPGRLSPTVHVLQAFASRESAIESLQRKWRLLFPAESALVWREPTVTRSHRRAERPGAASRQERRT